MICPDTANVTADENKFLRLRSESGAVPGMPLAVLRPTFQTLVCCLFGDTGIAHRAGTLAVSRGGARGLDRLNVQAVPVG